LGFGLVVAASFVACGKQTPSTESAQPAPGPAAQSGSGGKSNVRININEIFPPGPGRDLVLNNCTSCHTFVPIVILQMEKEAWERNRRDHRDRVAGLSDEEVGTLYEYVTANFNPERPVPELPKELLKTWTSY
jgi:hypothetical protein